MEMAPGLRALAEKITNLRDWQAEREAERAAWDEATEGAMRPALVALADSLGEVGRELDAAAAGVEALERLAEAIEALADAPDGERYIVAFNRALSELVRRLGDGGRVFAAVNATIERIEPARAEANAEIRHRDFEAAQAAAREREARERREAEERKRTALAAAAAAIEALATVLPEVTEPPAATNELAA